MVITKRRLSSVGLYLLACAALLGPFAGCERAPDYDKSEIRRVVVVHIDATPADDLSCYGGIARTPHIDSVADVGMRFTNAIVSQPRTSPSAASFLTGRLTNRHGVYNVGGKLKDEYITVAEVLKEHGFITAGFTGNPALAKSEESRKSAGFEQGLDVFECTWRKLFVPAGLEYNAVPRKNCVRLTKAALQFVDAHKNDRFFLWTFYEDPHAPYSPPPPYDTMYLDNETLLKESKILTKEKIHHRAYVPGRVRSHEYIARHLGEVTFTDAWIGKLLEGIKGLPGRTLIIITADHGESLGDRDQWFIHGANIRHSSLNVPLIIACEGIIPAGTSHALVANIDLAPTILDMLGIPSDSLGADGVSLAGTFWRRKSPWPKRMIPIQNHKGERWRGVRSERFSFQCRFHNETGELVGEQLYDLQNDPRETKSVRRQHPLVARRMAAFMEDWFSPERERAQEEDLSTDPEMRERLKSLGYL